MNFWTAFGAGLAAPTLLYAPQANYAALANVLSPAQSFAIVGYDLSQASEPTRDAERAGTNPSSH
jgi:hypothetical protein